MTEYWKDDDFSVIKEKVMPVSVKYSQQVDDIDNLLVENPACISFAVDDIATFNGKGAFVVLDFGKELCGSLRLVTRAVLDGVAKFRITLPSCVIRLLLKNG